MFISCFVDRLFCLIIFCLFFVNVKFRCSCFGKDHGRPVNCDGLWWLLHGQGQWVFMEKPRSWQLGPTYSGQTIQSSWILRWMPLDGRAWTRLWRLLWTFTWRSETCWCETVQSVWPYVWISLHLLYCGDGICWMMGYNVTDKLIPWLTHRLTDWLVNSGIHKRLTD